MRRHDSRYIECLCGSLHGDADLCGLLRDRSERYVLVSEKGHVAMYLIADDKHVVGVAEIRKANERLTTPTYSARVVRITQDKYSAFVITNSLKTLKVHLIIVASLHVVGLKRLWMNFQRIPHHLTLVGAWHKEERMINRWHYDDFLIGLAEKVADKPYALDDSRYKANPLWLYIPVVVCLNPVYYRGAIVGWFHGVTKDWVLQTLAQRVKDVGQNREIHVGHPQGLQVVTSPTWQQGLVHEVAAALSVYYCIEIVFHAVYNRFSLKRQLLIQGLFKVNPRLALCRRRCRQRLPSQRSGAR